MLLFANSATHDEELYRNLSSNNITILREILENCRFKKNYTAFVLAGNDLPRPRYYPIDVWNRTKSYTREIRYIFIDVGRQTIGSLGINE